MIISAAVISNSWTAGQRVNLSSSPFIWRQVTANSYTELPINIDNWKSGAPDNLSGVEFCLALLREYSYAWDDLHCENYLSSVCEIDLA